ncbi:hypothetical protein [Pararhizobium gei]|uniref:hypothetical protein n=1 Tax=Pararhizobium gei TaxID=1395951 RepID=UPI0023DC5145|nr:hypothetical protein [Rhizobium gei]
MSELQKQRQWNGETTHQPTHAPENALNRMVGALAGQINDALAAQRIAGIRRSTRREIENLPVGLQRDLAFSDGALVDGKRS